MMVSIPQNKSYIARNEPSSSWSLCIDTKLEMSFKFKFTPFIRRISKSYLDKCYRWAFFAADGKKSVFRSQLTCSHIASFLRHAVLAGIPYLNMDLFCSNIRIYVLNKARKMKKISYIDSSSFVSRLRRRSSCFLCPE